MKNSAMSFLLFIFLLYVGFCGYLYIAQRSFIYFPVPESRNVPAEDLRILMDGATVQIWRLHATQQDAVIYFGGNAEDVSQNIAQFERLFPDKAIYLVNYRGYGASTGAPSEAALLGDAQAVFDHISETHSGISIVGRSLGSGVAVFLAATRSAERLVLVTPYDSIAKLAQSSFPIFPVSAMLKDRYDSLSHASSISLPTLMLIAEQDEVIPMWSSQNLAAAIDPSVISVNIVANATHNTIQDFDQYSVALGQFLR